MTLPDSKCKEKEKAVECLIHLPLLLYRFPFSEPIVVLVLSLIFIASVFVLHIWGKYTRGA